MNDDARKGRQIVLIIIVGLLLPNLIIGLVPGHSLWKQAGRLAISVVMCFLLWRGYSWARSYLAFSLAVGTFLMALSCLVLPFVVWWGVLFLLFPPLYAWGTWALWSSPKVEAYIEYRERERNPDMSFNVGA